MLTEQRWQLIQLLRQRSNYLPDKAYRLLSLVKVHTKLKALQAVIVSLVVVTKRNKS